MDTAEIRHPQFLTLVTGHFREGPTYNTWRRRGTDGWLLIATLSGSGRFGYDGGELLVSAGDLVLLSPGTTHDYGTMPGYTEWELLWTHFHLEPAKLAWLDWPASAPGLLSLRLAPSPLWEQVKSTLFEMHRYATGPQRRREHFALNALEEALLWCDTQNPRSAQVRLDPRILAAMETLCRDLTKPLDLTALAAGCSLSASRFAHLFRSQSGLTPTQFLERQRLSRACQLLDYTALSVGTVALDVGYENPFYFTLRFKRFTGLSPRDYRKRNQQKEATK